jgi:catechol 2,3-dioxygenase-like lactoylglutathione lyase family enzyme
VTGQPSAPFAEPSTDVGGLVLASSEAVAFLPSQDLDRSLEFYSGLLGLPIVSQSPMACVFRCGPTNLRVTKVESLRPQPFTVFGWVVTDMRATVEQLEAAGRDVLRYGRLDQDERGIWTTPNGDLVTWFADPDLNVLSLTQLAAH